MLAMRLCGKMTGTVLLVLEAPYSSGCCTTSQATWPEYVWEWLELNKATDCLALRTKHTGTTQPSSSAALPVQPLDAAQAASTAEALQSATLIAATGGVPITPAGDGAAGEGYGTADGAGAMDVDSPGGAANPSEAAVDPQVGTPSPLT
jgi:hypothetical protein